MYDDYPPLLDEPLSASEAVNVLSNRKGFDEQKARELIISALSAGVIVASATSLTVYVYAPEVGDICEVIELGHQPIELEFWGAMHIPNSAEPVTGWKRYGNYSDWGMSTFGNVEIHIGHELLRIPEFHHIPNYGLHRVEVSTVARDTYFSPADIEKLLSYKKWRSLMSAIDRKIIGAKSGKKTADDSEMMKARIAALAAIRPDQFKNYMDKGEAYQLVNAIASGSVDERDMRRFAKFLTETWRDERQGWRPFDPLESHLPSK